MKHPYIEIEIQRKAYREWSLVAAIFAILPLAACSSLFINLAPSIRPWRPNILPWIGVMLALCSAGFVGKRRNTPLLYLLFGCAIGLQLPGQLFRYLEVCSNPRESMFVLMLPYLVATVGFGLLTRFVACIAYRYFRFPAFDHARCVVCRYPLFGLASHRCPECGTPFPNRPISSNPTKTPRVLRRSGARSQSLFAYCSRHWDESRLNS